MPLVKNDEQKNGDNWRKFENENEFARAAADAVPMWSGNGKSWGTDGGGMKYGGTPGAAWYGGGCRFWCWSGVVVSVSAVAVREDW